MKGIIQGWEALVLAFVFLWIGLIKREGRLKP